MKLHTRPSFWQPQPHGTHAVRQVIRRRVERALCAPVERSHLVWPAVLGAPTLRARHPEGIPGEVLWAQAARMLAAVACPSPEEAWRQDRLCFPDTAQRGPTGWLPHPAWATEAERVSLRCAVILLALTGRPEDERYPLASAVELFNLCLFHECHDALEIPWRQSDGLLKSGLQGLILLACGFHHQQCGNTAGMRSVWKDELRRLDAHGGVLETPWGRVGYAGSLDMARTRLEWLKALRPGDDTARFWELPSPAWEFE